MSNATRIEVILRWGGDVVEVRRIDERALSFTIGRRDDDDLFVPLDAVASARVLERASPAHPFRVCAPGGVVDVVGSLDDERGVCIAAGPFTVTLKRSERAHLAWFAPVFDAIWANTATLTLASMALFVAAISLAPPALPDDEPLASHASLTRAMILRAVPPLTTTTSALPSTPAKRPTPPVSAASLTPQRPPARAETAPHRQSDEQVVEARLAALFGDVGVSALGGGGGDDVERALGGVVSRSPASVGGATLAALAAREGGASSGATGTVHLGAIATGTGPWADGGDGSAHLGMHREHQIIDLPMQEPESVGYLDKAIIRRVIQAHANEVRACYERALLRGTGETKVVVQLEISPSGAVPNASASESSGDAHLDDCIAGRVRTWRFPSTSKNRGTTIVHYPFVLRGGT
ncbi:MAG TPA: AgmX/PglI C-terminal domain-containing protein [Myxococcota bacterium]